jgi:hypothetical protein
LPQQVCRRKPGARDTTLPAAAMTPNLL